MQPQIVLVCSKLRITFCALLHAAAEEVETGRRKRTEVSTLLSATAVRMLRRSDATS